MFELYHNETDEMVGQVTADQLQFLVEYLEENSDSDRDYELSVEVLEMLEEAGADEVLLEVLQDALGDDEIAEIRWEEPR